MRAAGQSFSNARDFLYLGRGIHFPIALEGALKLKEISYIHAEGYPAGEMKHGPNALIDETLPVVVLATRDESDPASKLRYEKTLSNIQEVTARSGRVIAVATEGDTTIGGLVEHVIHIPPAIELLVPAHRDRPAAAAGLLHRRPPRLRRGPAPQPGQIRDGRVSESDPSQCVVANVPASIKNWPRVVDPCRITQPRSAVPHRRVFRRWPFFALATLTTQHLTCRCEPDDNQTGQFFPPFPIAVDWSACRDRGSGGWRLFP